MKRYTGILFFFFYFLQSIFGQSHKPDSILIKAKDLNKILNIAGKLNAFDDGDSVLIINALIGEKLSELLVMPAIVNYNLDSLIEHDLLGIIHSPDSRFWIFNWYENTGGTFQSNINLLHYHTESGIPKVAYDYNAESGQNAFCSSAAWFSKIYKLHSDKDIYLAIGSVVGCASCCAVIASVIQLAGDSINLQYPAFAGEGDDPHTDDRGGSPCYQLDSRCGNIEKFGFDEKKQTISFTYYTNELSPDYNPGKTEKINGTLVFDGKEFFETTSKE